MTIREAAEKLGVTTKTVYKRLNQNDTKGLTEVINGVTHVTPEGQRFLGIEIAADKSLKNKELDERDKLIKDLSAKLDERDKLIKDLLAKLDEKDRDLKQKDRDLKQWGDEFRRIVDQQQQLQLQQQLAAPAKRKWLPPWRKEKNPS